MATFLFNPLVFVLAFTFMTDAHFAALLVIATWLYARALGPEGIDGRLLVAGSGVAALAFLTRQQGALIVPAVLTFLLLTRRLHVRPGKLRASDAACCAAVARCRRLLPLAAQ